MIVVFYIACCCRSCQSQISFIVRPLFKCSSFVHCLFIIWLFIYQLVIVCRSILSVTPLKWLCLMLIVTSERKYRSSNNRSRRLSLLRQQGREARRCSTHNQMMGHVLIVASKRNILPVNKRLRGLSLSRQQGREARSCSTHNQMMGHVLIVASERNILPRQQEVARIIALPTTRS